MKAHPVISREKSGLSEPRMTMLRLLKKDVKRQVLHHTAGIQLPVSAGLVRECEYWRAVQQGHFARGFSDIAYHFGVAPSGRIYVGRDFDYQGAGVYGENEDTVHVVVFGSYHIPSNKPTRQAIEAAAQAFKMLPGTRRKLYGHCEIGASECPGDNLLAKKAEIARLRKETFK